MFRWSGYHSKSKLELNSMDSSSQKVKVVIDFNCNNIFFISPQCSNCSSTKTNIQPYKQSSMTSQHFNTADGWTEDWGDWGENNNFNNVPVTSNNNIVSNNPNTQPFHNPQVSLAWPVHAQVNCIFLHLFSAISSRCTCAEPKSI